MNPVPTCTEPSRGEWLAGYEMDLLSPEERASFESHVAACSACLEELYSLAAYVAVMQRDPLMVLERSKATSAGPARAFSAEGERILARLRAWWVRSIRRPLLAPAVAAAIVVAIGVTLFLQLTPPGPLPQRSAYAKLARIEAVPYVPLETRDAAAPKALQLYRDGMARYAERRYGEAVPQLRAAAEALRTASGDESARRREQAQLFLGISLLLDERPEEARGPLESAARSPLAVVSDRASWYLAQAALLLDDPEVAAGHLERLAGTSPGYGAEATRQLGALRQMQSP